MAIQNWPKTNVSGDWASVDGIVWSENQAANTVNDSARAMGRDLAKWHGDLNATLTTGGSSNAYTLTSNGSYATLANGFCLAFKANHTNTGAATLNVDTLGAKAIRKFNSAGEAALSASDIVNGGHYLVQYNTAANAAAGGWILLNPNTVATGDIADDAVTAAKIAANAVGSSELADNAVDTAAIAANAVTAAKIERNANTGFVIKSAGSGSDPAWSAAWTLGTPVTSTSGTAVQFTGIPASARCVVMLFNGVSTTGSDDLIVQIGPSGGVETTGYTGSYTRLGSGVFTSTTTSGIIVSAGALASRNHTGRVTFRLLDQSSNIWVGDSLGNDTATPQHIIASTVKTLAGVLERIRVTTTGGTDTFDSGSINIMYE